MWNKTFRAFAKAIPGEAEPKGHSRDMSANSKARSLRNFHKTNNPCHMSRGRESRFALDSPSRSHWPAAGDGAKLSNKN